jgi:hypothetical protein
MPFQRLERLQGQLGMPLPATTQWDLMAPAAKLIRPVLEELIRQAAQGSVMHNDDTGMRILRLTREPGDQRTGTFTSGIVSMVGAWTIALFFTGWKHAGENLGEVLKQRARELPAPIQMCDALSRNTPKGVETLVANCLAHYLDSGIIQSEFEIRYAGRGGNGVSEILTPDKASQTFEEREQLGRWPPLSWGRRVKPGALPKGLQHLAFHLKVGR